MDKRRKLLIASLLFLLVFLPLIAFRVEEKKETRRKAAGGENTVSPTQGFLPMVYELFGRADASYPAGTGAVGAWAAVGWDEIQPRKPSSEEPSPNDPSFNWGPIESYLNSFVGKTTTYKNGKVVKRPVGVQIQLLAGGCESSDTPKSCRGLQLPDWLIDEIEDNGGTIPAHIPRGEQCGKAYYPPWRDETFQKRWAQMMLAFGKKYDGDPRLAFIHIATGPYGEAIETMFNPHTYYENGTQKRCPRYDVNLDGRWLLGDPDNSLLYKKGVIHIAREAFKETPVFIINTGYNTRKELAERALQVTPHVGIKMHSWHPDLPQQLDEKSQANVFKWYAAHCGNDCLAGLEHAYAENRPTTYWAMLYALTHNADSILDISSRHIVALRQVEDCEHFEDCFPLWEFVESHLGRRAEIVPDVFVVLRDTSFRDCQSDGSCGKTWDRRGEPGNWERYLKLLCERSDGAMRICEEYPAVNCQQDLRSPFNRADSRRIYGCWSGEANRVARKITARKNRMRFQIDPDWPAKRTVGFDIEVTYIDEGSDQWKLEYKNAAGEIKQVAVRKTDTGRFIRKRLALPDAKFTSPFAGGGDFRIYNNNDGEDWIHMVRVIPRNWRAPAWELPAITGFPTRPANTPTPPSTITTSPSPPVISPPASRCDWFGDTQVDARSASNLEVKQRQPLFTSWWHGDSALEFTPRQTGKLDKIELFVSGQGTIQVGIATNKEMVENTLLVTLEKEVSLPQGRFLRFNFPWKEEPLVESGRNYVITFRAVDEEDNLFIGRDFSWQWIYSTWVRPCRTGKRPTNTPTPSQAPTFTPTPTSAPTSMPTNTPTPTSTADTTCDCQGASLEKRRRGDYDCQNGVNFDDYLVWVIRFVQGKAPDDNLNCDPENLVGPDDFTTWATNYHSSLSP